MDRVSFVIPSHNNAAWLPHAVKSVQDQEYPDLEIVIVNDGSTDSTNKYLDWLREKDMRVVVLNNRVAEGRSAARNAGNLLASGKYICVLDSDDLAHKNRAKLTAKKLESAEFVYGSCDVIDTLGNKVGYYQADVFDKKKALETKLNNIVHSTVGYTKDFALRYMYPIEKYISDLGLDDWAQQTKAYMDGVKMDFITQNIGAYRILNTAISSKRDPVKVNEAKEHYLDSLKVSV